MTEGDRIPVGLLEEAAGRPPTPVPLTEANRVRLVLLDAYLEKDLFPRMEKDREYKLKHKEWEYRQFQRT